MREDNDAGARRNRSDANGLWLINILVCALVTVLSLYVFRADLTRDEARTTLAAVEAMPAAIAAPPAMAAGRAD